MQLNNNDNKQMMMNFSGIQNVNTQGDDKSRMSNLLQNRVGRGTQGRNNQVLNGMAPGESMKVSETRDSSFQVLPSTGLGGASQFLNLQTNYNNMNMGEFDDVSTLLTII